VNWLSKNGFSGNGQGMGAALLRGILLGATFSVIFAAGFWFRGTISPAVAQESTPFTSVVGEYPLLTEAQTLLNQNYLREQPDQRQLEYAAIRGMLSALNDRFTYFIDPPVAASESNVLAGQYGGIGVLVKRDEAGQFALYPFREGPATRAGVQDGDLLRQVNGADVPLETGQDAVDQMLRGEVKADGGTPNGVTILVLRPSDNTEYTFTIPFEVIEVPSVVWRVLAEAPEYGYIQILRFTNRTPGELDTAFAELRAASVKGLVLDLRNNPGGLLQESIQVAGKFLDGGVILIQATRDGETVFEADTPDPVVDLPMIVIVNNGTASAAELVAGALRDRGRAILIGQTTYGKGSVQKIFSLADKSSIHVTTAEWFPPSRNPLEGVGLTPEVPMIPDQTGRDVELGEAIRRLQQQG
jgi:carboxyl-terminal processing protease